jgi:transcriptional regulator with XRE-family HTH domain
MIERGTRIPTTDVLEKIASHLKVKVGQLMEPGPSAAERTMAGQLKTQIARDPGEVGLGRRLKALRADRGVSVRALCEGAAGTAIGLKAWLVREFEIGSRAPTEAELELLAGAFGYVGVQELQAALDQMVVSDPDEGLILSESRAARRLAYDRDSADWAELVLRATSRGFTGDQLVINGDLLAENCDHITRGAMVLVDRSVRVDEGDPVICMNRKEVIGFGRVENGTVRDANGAELRGSIWRVVAILYS